MAKNKWFEVDKTGLSKILERRGKSFVVFELLQNAWDQNVTMVDVLFNRIKGRQAVRLVVTDDDPEGFQDLSHAFTLFAESSKKNDPTKRGRFNLGEKLVLACCQEAQVLTTSGGVKFTENGQRKTLRKKTEKGSEFSAVIKMTKAEYDEVCESVDMLIPPRDIVTTFNTKVLKANKPVASFVASLPTDSSDEEGYLKKTIRKTRVDVYEVQKGETAFLYELGIPVVETGDTYHVDIQQKVLLNMDRDNVTPAYLRTVRTLVFNNTFNLLQEEDVNRTWARDAISDKKCTDEAVTKSLDLRFGKKRVIYDPSDPEANKKAVSKGYKVIHGSQFSKDAWDNIKRTGTTLPAGQVTPAKPQGFVEATRVEPTAQMEQVIRFSKTLAKKLMEVSLLVTILKVKTITRADYKKSEEGAHLRFNLTTLHRSFFDDFPNNMEEVINLLIHEFGHQYNGDHLSSEYYKALTELGAKATVLAVKEPQVFTDV